MQKRMSTILNILQSTEQRVNSAVSSGKMMISQRHYASTQINHVIDCVQNALKMVGKVTNRFFSVAS